MQNSGPTSPFQNSFFTVLSNFWQLITGTNTPNEAAPPNTSDMPSAANESRKRSAEAVYDASEKAPEGNPKVQRVDSASKDEQFVQEQLLNTLDNAFKTGVFPYLLNKDLANLSASCRQLNEWTLGEKEQRIFTLLMKAVVQGNEEEAKRLLALTPSLLRNKNTDVVDYSGRQIKRLTPFQAALCAGDIEMCEMMKPYFAELQDGRAELERQYHEIFPNGIDAQVAQQTREVFDFIPLLNAMKVASEADVQIALKKKFKKDTPLNHAFKEFRAQFHRKSLSETIYNPQHLLRAFQMYVNEFDNLPWDKRDLFYRQVIGFVQRYLPACYAQAFAYGLYDIANNLHPLVRSLQFKHEKDISILPCGTSSGLGYDWAVGGRQNSAWGGERASPERRAGIAWKNYIDQKHQACKNYLRQPSDASSNVCTTELCGVFSL